MDLMHDGDPSPADIARLNDRPGNSCPLTRTHP